MEETYYDAHVKTHQRHILIEWLESAKNEKLRAVKEQTVIPTKKYNVPREVPEVPAIAGVTEEEKTVIAKNSRIYP